MKTTRLILAGAAAFGATLFISLGIDVSGKSSATRFDGPWSGLLECSGKNEPWQNRRSTRIREGVISYSQGEPGQNGYETWEGRVGEKSEVRIAGHYVWSRQKPLELNGLVEADTLTATGRRGPRRCTLTLTRDDAPDDLGG